MFGLNKLGTIVFELAERNNISDTFNKAKNMVERLYSFLRRHTNLSLRSPEPTSMTRATGFNVTAVRTFYKLLGSVYENSQLTPDHIYNVDETGIMTVPNKESKVLNLRGTQQIGTLVSGELDSLVTAEICMNASGNFMPTKSASQTIVFRRCPVWNSIPAAACKRISSSSGSNAL
ncbi:hypothetical protein ILUMI_13064 [Ignelater luminosus]|uniref:Uncharacterized protein n=1 Tax=Ignelater luminosus TaxID=2038154 RepID=A0A8K0CSY7_IGNLU|nr:hypothetical protein ILUMI_13064 [Ignelater luminosus]